MVISSEPNLVPILVYCPGQPLVAEGVSRLLGLVSFCSQKRFRRRRQTSPVFLLPLARFSYQRLTSASSSIDSLFVSSAKIVQKGFYRTEIQGTRLTIIAGRVGFEPTICGSAGRRLGPGSTTGPRRRIHDSPYNGYNGEPNLSPSYFSSPNRQQFHM